jgi:LmbE family N-acetylglucosaminyl deacetylase
VKESIAAMRYLGIPEENLRFLRLPEARLKRNLPALTDMLMASIKVIMPDHIFMPFRYDRHPDHLAINHVLTEACQQGRFHARLIEYFVYYRWKLLPKRDIRAYIKPECLIEIDVEEVSKQKRMALDFFKSQTTRYYSWQTRPILTPRLLDEESRNPEYFLVHDHALPGIAVFTKSKQWIRLTHRSEPFLKKWKYLVGAFTKRVFQEFTGHEA